MAHACDCWQADTSAGPMIKVDGQKRRAHLVMTIDDASRLILHGEFFFNDNATNFQVVLKKSIAKYGVPKNLFVDNGGPYKNDQLSMICASLGVSLIHAKPYTAKSKGKVERSFRTIKDNWLNGIDWNEFDSLDSLNIAFNKFLNEKYTNSVHSALGISPRERYLQDTSKIKFIPSEKLEDHFLNRVTRRVNNDATVQLNNLSFEVPQKYIGQKINIRYSPSELQKAYVFNKDNILTDTIYLLKRIDNSKIKRKPIDYTIFKEAGIID
jgi:transposase InsO family protein